MRRINSDDIDFAKGYCKDAEGWYLEEIEGDLLFFQNGYLQSINDEPAVIYKTGSKFWYEYGELHRETGPAIMYNNGKNVYHIRGEELSKEDFTAHMLNKELKNNNSNKKVKI